MTDDAQSDGLPTAFVHFRDLVRIHVKQILTLDKKPPMHAATLLMLVACEALSTLLGKDDEHDVFARDLLSKRGVPYHVGKILFDALRNGLAHDYTPGRIVVGREGRCGPEFFGVMVTASETLRGSGRSRVGRLPRLAGPRWVGWRVHGSYAIVCSTCLTGSQGP
jgi:hypothetical protein